MHFWRIGNCESIIFCTAFCVTTFDLDLIQSRLVSVNAMGTCCSRQPEREDEKLLEQKGEAGIEIRVYAQMPWDKDRLTLVLALPEDEQERRLCRTSYSIAEICERSGGHSVMELISPMGERTPFLTLDNTHKLGPVFSLDPRQMVCTSTTWIRGIDPSYVQYVTMRDLMGDVPNGPMATTMCLYCNGVFGPDDYKGYTTHIRQQVCRVRDVLFAAHVQPVIDRRQYIFQVNDAAGPYGRCLRNAEHVRFAADQSFGRIVDMASGRQRIDNGPYSAPQQPINPGATSVV